MTFHHSTVFVTPDGIGRTIVNRTAIEIANNITPTDLSYEPYDVRRYGVPLDGTDATKALTAVAALPLIFPTDTTCTVLSNVTLNGDIVFNPGATIKPATGKWVKFTGRVQETGQSILAAGAGGNIILTNDPQYSYANATYNVVAAPVNPNDFSTIQAAFNAVPRYIKHVITVAVADGTYTETPALTNKHLIDSTPAEFFITGDVATPANVIVHGLIARDCTGYLAPKINGFQFSGGLGSTGGDEAVVIFIGCNRASVQNTIIDGTGIGASGKADVGLMAYSSNVDTQTMTITTCNNRIKSKHGGQVNNTNTAIQSPVGEAFFNADGNGFDVETKMLGYRSAPTNPVPDATNVQKGFIQGITYDQYTGGLYGPGFFLSATSTIEDYFSSIDGYTTANIGDGAVGIGAEGLLATVSTGVVSIVLQRTDVLTSNSLIRPLFFIGTLKINSLPAGETIYFGSGNASAAAGDFIGLRITSAAIDGIVRRSGTTVVTNLFTGAVSGTQRLGFFYSPQASDTNVEATPTDFATFFRLAANTAVYQTMTGTFSDVASMANRFTLYCDGVVGPVSVNVPGYKYVKA